jgi:phosphomannomutase
MDLLSLKSGTDIRGIASEGVKGEHINLTDENIRTIASAFLVWCEEKIGKKADTLKIALGHDSRISADRICNDIMEILVKKGVTLLDCGLASTPSMFMSVIEIPCDASIQITASHHPFNRNGLKFFLSSGGLDSSDIEDILILANSGAETPDRPAGQLISENFMSRYSADLRHMIQEGVKSDNYSKPLEGFHIVVDAGNGAGGFYATDVLSELGADVSGSQFLDPDGRFPNHIPNPENAEAMKSVSSATVKNHADLGVIFDTDVDRAGAVDKNGDEINRNALIALASAIALEGHRGGTIVTDSVTSDGLHSFIEGHLGGKHYRYRRGYKNVINEAVRLNSEGIDCPLAIETSGHAALRENYFLDDGAYLVTKIIIKAAQLKKDGKDISDLLGALKYPYEEKELRFKITDPDFRKYGENIISSLNEYASGRSWNIAPDNREGIRISFGSGKGDGWMLLRMSVHDPVMPLNIESNSSGGARMIASQLLEFFRDSGFKNIDISPLSSFVG